MIAFADPEVTSMSKQSAALTAVAFCTSCGRENTVEYPNNSTVCSYCLKALSHEIFVPCPHCETMIDLTPLAKDGRGSGPNLRCSVCAALLANTVPLTPRVPYSAEEAYRVSGVPHQSGPGAVLPIELAWKAHANAYASWARESKRLDQRFRGLHSADGMFRLEYEALLQHRDESEVSKLVHLRHLNLMDRIEGQVNRFVQACADKYGGEDVYGFVRLDRFVDDVPAFLNAAAGALGATFEDLSFEEIVRRFPAAERYSSQWVTEQLRDQLHRHHAMRKPPDSLTEVDNLPGHEFESYLERRLQSNGFHTAWKTKGSGDQGADLVVDIDSRRLVIQAKRYKGSVPLGAVQEVYFAKIPYAAGEAWIVTNSVVTPQALRGANLVGINVIDRATLQYLEIALRTGVTDPVRLARLHAESLLMRPMQIDSTSLQGHKTEGTLRTDHNNTGGGIGTQRHTPFLSQSPVSNTSLRLRESSPQTILDRNVKSRRGPWFRLATLSKLVIIALALAVGSVAIHVLVLQAAESGSHATLARWVESMRAGNATEQASCYAQTVERFFRDRNVSNQTILKAKQEMLAQYPNVVKYELSNVRFEKTGWFETVVTFDKAWDARGNGSFAGSEKQRLTLTGSPFSPWKIKAEDELEIYWVNRRK